MIWKIVWKSQIKDISKKLRLKTSRIRHGTYGTLAPLGKAIVLIKNVWRSGLQTCYLSTAPLPGTGVCCYNFARGALCHKRAERAENILFVTVSSWNKQPRTTFCYNTLVCKGMIKRIKSQIINLLEVKHLIKCFTISIYEILKNYKKELSLSNSTKNSN